MAQSLNKYPSSYNACSIRPRGFGDLKILRREGIAKGIG
jgi:hypothetical protein